MSEGLVLPVGADLTELNAAFASISASAVKMGAKLNATMAGSQAAFNKLPRAAPSMAGAFQSAFSRIGSSGQSMFRGMAATSQATMAAISRSMSALGFAGGIGGIGGIGAALAVTMKSVSSAADMETLETAFAPLLGGADKAQVRIKELAKFAADTPFELPEVAKASRVLEVLTRGTLATGNGLRMVGDVAATTGQPFEELALWIGRLYDGLQSGRPVGEALARLQELGVVTGGVRGRIEELQKSGAAGNEVWQVAAGALGRFSGAMETQSQTWNGKMSNFKGNVANALAEFGKPIMDSLKPYLDSVTRTAENLGKTAADWGKRVAESVRFISAAFSSGQMGALVGKSIKLGFITATNFLWRSLHAAFAGAGQYLIEYFRTGIEMFRILGTADFWRGMGNSLIGIFLDTVAFFQKGISAAMESVRPLAEMIGQGDKIDSAKNVLGESAGILREEAAAYYAKAGAQLKPQLDRITSRLETALKNIGDRAATAFNKAGDLIDPTATAAEARGLKARIQATMDAAKKEIEGSMKAAKVSVEQPEASLKAAVARSAAPAVMSLTRIGGGGFASTVMNNLIAETKRQTGYLKTIATNTAGPNKTAPAAFA